MLSLQLKFKKSIALLCCFFLLSPLITQAAKINIFSSINTYNQIASQIGGTQVTTTTPPYLATQDPHDFSPNVSIIKQIYQADIIIGNGLKVDGWLETILHNTHNKTILIAAKLRPNIDNYDQHLWYSPTIIIEMAKQLTELLSIKDPHNKNYYHDNLSQFEKHYTDYTKFLMQIKQNNKDVTIAAPESFFNNLATYLNFTTKTQAIQNATRKDLSGSPRDIAQFIELLKEHRVKLFLYNSQVANKSILYLKSYAIKYDIPVVTLQETQPQNIDYFTWQEAQLLKITATLHKS